ERDLVGVAPAPVLARLERADDRVRRCVMVGGRMAVGRVVAAADVTARQTDAEMEPLAAAAQAVLAAVHLGGEFTHLDLVEMGAGARRGSHAGERSGAPSLCVARRPGHARRGSVVGGCMKP